MFNTTANVLITMSTNNWNSNNEKYQKHFCRDLKNIATVAEKELRETPSTKEQALNIMREWIQKNNDIRNVRQDENFLLRFLRHKKYSIPMAQQTLLKYLNLRKYYPECFSNLDCEEPKLKEIISNGYIAVSPVRDNAGRRVIVYNMGKFNATKFTCWDMCRAHCVVYETLMEDPTEQILGFVHVGDGSGSTTAHVTSWNPLDFARLLKWGEQSLPMRHKSFQLVNVPAALKYIVDIGMTKVSPKMGQRLQVHTNTKNLCNHVEERVLPTNFGGKIPLEEMITYTQDLLLQKRKVLLSLDSMEILSTNGIISSRKSNSDVTLVTGSFRKLEID
ncbi:retinaldehyde-binding protein 1 [Aricia agestis]|uniref:retinaldehyde-binding protein 1 n=1 Tax=Aricia agestis TaxID=91739 RepID=UPI001C202650|nr:retinaldehyde-binding protein 1 [Aricia agestis]